MTGTIYGIFDGQGHCVYVGQTYTPLERRLSRHVASAMQGRKNPFHAWLQERLVRFEKPAIRSLISGVPCDTRVGRQELDELEQFYIHRLLGQGQPLLNKEAA